MNLLDKFFKKGEDGKGITYVYILIILILAVIIFSFTNKNITKKKVDNTQDVQQVVMGKETLSYEEQLQQRLEESLSQISGVGKVDVVIMTNTGPEKVIDKDVTLKESDSIENDGSGGNRTNNEMNKDEKTTLLNKSDGTTSPIIIKEKMPVVQGVIIIADNGDQPEIRKNLIKAAEILLNVGPHKIEVFKRK